MFRESGWLGFDQVSDFMFMSSDPRTRYFENRRPWKPGIFREEVMRLVRREASLLTKANRPARWRSPEGRLVFFVYSRNNYDSMQPVREQLPDSYLLSANYSLPWGHLLPSAPIALISLIFLPILLWKLSTARGHLRKALLGSFHEYVVAYGLYYWSLLYLRKNRPRGMVFSNDHKMEPRVLLAVCNRIGIPTFFIPHGVQDPACIPPLEFDYSYLFGSKSLDDYRRAGLKGRKVYLVGVPKFDVHSHYLNEQDGVRRLGICTNELTQADAIVPLLRLMKLEFPDIEVGLRPHPRDNRAIFDQLCRAFEFNYSDPRTENSFDFLRGVDAIVAGDTGILLEAALMNVCPVYFEALGVGGDMMGFVRSRLAIEATDESSLREILSTLIARKPDVRARAKRYVASVHTPAEGKSAELVARLIEEDLCDFSSGDGSSYETVTVDATRIAG